MSSEDVGALSTRKAAGKGLRIPPPVLALLCGLGMWVLANRLPVWQIVPAPWNQFGWWVMDLSAVAPLIAFIQFGRARTTVDPLTPGSASMLVTSGIYAWTRNPMYLGLAALLCGLAIRLGALAAFLGPILFVALIHYFQIRFEEHALLLRFGEQYEQYRRTVRRWLGRFPVGEQHFPK